MSNIEIKIEPDAEVPEPSVGEKRPAQENPLKLAKRFKKRLEPNQNISHKTIPINNQVKTQNSSNEDRNLYFFKSLLPSLALLDEDQVLQFQAGVISLIQDIKSRRNEWSNQQPYPFHYLHQPSPSTSMQSSSHIDDGQLSPAEDTDYILKVSDLTN
ncbi:uncharacterized protein LOC114354724 [Ostrinia furnacalis]|uniref:uncharacterized protein LOC114354724 n=1 Tax=Ostrinia furnacalis TaxID=93504 RepID=UPI00103FEDCF|nr:uncharacterized protein LOC114354724 [Ostrinia furnacalis]